MDRKKVRRAILLGGAVLAVLGAAALVTLLPGHDAGAVGRRWPKLVGLTAEP
jgi:hypothetical protein